MSLPTNKIKKIKLPGDVDGNKTYEIIPEKMQNSGYEAALPTLTADDTLATTKTTQTISGAKTFSASPILNNAIQIRGKNASNTAVNLIGISASNNVLINNENSADTLVGGGKLAPISAKSGSLDLGGTSNKFKDLYISGGIKNGTLTWTMPSSSGTLALTSDIAGKQDTLVSGTNIKTINNNSILGSGDITISCVSIISATLTLEE